MAMSIMRRFRPASKLLFLSWTRLKVTLHSLFSLEGVRIRHLLDGIRIASAILSIATACSSYSHTNTRSSTCISSYSSSTHVSTPISSYKVMRRTAALCAAHSRRPIAVLQHAEIDVIINVIGATLSPPITII